MSRPLRPPVPSDAPLLPEGASRAWLRHPGPERTARHDVARGQLRQETLHLRRGESLLAGVAREMDRLKASGGLLLLDSVPLAPLHFVMPDGPADEQRAAWYSETHRQPSGQLQRASASIGRKEGAWFVHCHALWTSPGNTPLMGHLLCEECLLAQDSMVPVLLCDGAQLVVTPDDETGFALFRPRQVDPLPPTFAGGRVRAAQWLTLQPHSDLRQSLETAAAAAGMRNAHIHGLGSLIGAGFLDAPPMRAPISEMLVLPGARLENGRCTALPVACVDPSGSIYQGDLAPGAGPVCVTCEILMVAD